MTIKIGKKSIITGAVILIALALYNVLYFVIPFNRDLSNGAYWVSYSFTTFFFVFAAFIVFLGIKDKELKSRVFGIPLIKLAIGSCFLQLAFDVIVMSVGNWFAFPTWVAVVVDSLIVAYVFIAVITRYAQKEHINKIDSYEAKTSFIKELRAEFGTLKSIYSSHELAKEINDIYEAAKFADPVSNKEVEPIEDQISLEVESLKKQLEAGEFDSSKKTICSINNLLVERKIRIKDSH